MRIPIRRVWLCLLAMLLLACGAPAVQAAGDGAARTGQPVLHTPEAPGDAVLGSEALSVDVSNAAQGYIMARYAGQSPRAVVQLTGPDAVTYKYFLAPAEDFVPLPLSGGSGTYAVNGYENIDGSTYATLFKQTLDAELENDLLPFLYPNQYVDFGADTQAVLTAAETAAGAASDLEAVERIYHYVTDHVIYDGEKAATVTAGYLPSVDDTLASGKGICFDYAALTAAMLRSQNIPARLEIGYSGGVYHSWISVFTQQTGWIDQLIEFPGGQWTRMDPTFASNGGGSEAILQYIGDNANYVPHYYY